jgi:hypothetical protein
MDARPILQPVFVMALLTTAMCIWMYVTRIPAMRRAGIDPGSATKESMQSLPPEVVRVADNYNHLFEQPTLFYAVALAVAVLGHVDAVHVACAWAFTVLRIAHSAVQATVNVIPVRFALFALSWVALAVMILRESVALLL